MTLKALIFDFDGTIVNSEWYHYLAYKDVLNDAMDLDYEGYERDMCGVENIKIAAQMRPELNHEQHEDIVRQKEDRFRHHVTQAQLRMIPVTKGLLEWGKAQGLPLGLVTNATRQSVMTMLPKLGLHGAFYTMVFGEEQEFMKPHPMPYRTALEELGISPDEAVVFEDTYSGITAAVAAGITTIAIGENAPEAGQAMTVSHQESPQTVIDFIS